MSKPKLEDHHNPTIISRDDSQALMDLLMEGVAKAIGEELDKRDIKPGATAALHVQATDMGPTRVSLVFRVELRGDGDTEIQFRGIL